MVPRSRALAAAALLGAGLALPTYAQTPLTAVHIAEDFEAPVDILAPPGDHDRLFIVEQRGTIRIVELDDHRVRKRVFLNIINKVTFGGEQGLLGMAFHPLYAINGYFYVNYTDNQGDTVVERYSVDPSNPNIADDTSGVTILGPIRQPFSNHNAGQLQFGPLDGYLYIGLGDGGSSGDPGCRSQDGLEFLGKMLRIDVDGGFPYVVPPDNPFLGDPEVLDEVWQLGLRNPWRYSFDRENGDLFIADVGQDRWEEIDYQPGTSLGGENWGWKIMEASSCFSTNNCDPTLPPCGDPAYSLPIHEYDHGDGCSITGGYVYRGCGIPDLQGTYFFADFCSSRIWSFEVQGGQKVNFQERTAELQPQNGGDFTGFATFGEDACGELYLAGLGGDLFKIVADVEDAATNLGYGKKGANGEKPRLELCGLVDAGNHAILRLRRGPANQAALLVVSDQMNPTDVWDGTLVPVPPLFFLFHTTDDDGVVETIVPGGLGAFTLYLQYLLRDPGNTFDTGFSNALQIDFE